MKGTDHLPKRTSLVYLEHNEEDSQFGEYTATLAMFRLVRT